MRSWLVGLAVIAACARPAEPVARIGLLAPMTGRAAAFGVPTQNGVLLALGETRGVRGRKIELVLVDDQGVPDEAEAGAKRLILDEQVHAILGPVDSAAALAAAPIAARARIPMLVPSATHPGVTAAGDTVFRACFDDRFQAEALAAFAKEIAGASRVAILEDLESAYSMALAEGFATAFAARGGKIHAKASYTHDTKAELAGLVGAELVLLPGTFDDVAPLVRAARAAGVAAPFLGGDGWASERLHPDPVLEGAWFVTHFAPGEAKEFVERYQARWNEPPDAFAALGYDAARWLALAIDQSRDLKGPTIASALRDLGPVAGVTGELAFDLARTAKKPAYVVQLVRGRPELAATIEPSLRVVRASRRP